jgi:hypothetical protein
VHAVADSKRFKKLLIAFFKKHKLVGVQCNKVHMSIIYNSAEEVIVQDAHTDFEFKKANTLRGCELLHVSRSFISQSDNQKLSNQISNLYDKRCSKITIQNI